MRYLDTTTLAKMGRRPVAARARRFIWLVWMQPHLRDGRPKQATRTQLRWPVYLMHGGAA